MAICRESWTKSPGAVLFWEKCVKRLHNIAFKIDGIEVEVVPSPIIYMRDLFLRLKRKKGPTTNLKEEWKERAPSHAEEVNEEETLLA